MAEPSFADQIASTKIQGGIVSSKGGFHVPRDHKAPGLPAVFLQFMMLVFLVVMGGGVYVNYGVLKLMQGLVAGDFATQEEYLTAAGPLPELAQSLQPVVLGAFILSVVAYFTFVYAAARNLDRARAVGFTHSPLGAIGVSFIPFANFVMIYRVMRDIWVSSHDPRRGIYSASVLLLPWWALYVGGNLSTRFADMMMNSAIASENLDGMITALWFSLAAFVALFVSSVLLFLIVGGIVRAQAGWSGLAAAPEAKPVGEPA